MVTFNNDWDQILKDEFTKDYYIELRGFLEKEYKEQIVLPLRENVFNAFKTTSFKETKVVILGQDPYHGENQSHGLAFSVMPGVRIPPSLRNMFKELHESLGCTMPNNGYLLEWANQGVLLLNTVLTVRLAEPNSHRKKGWEKFTDQVIRVLNEREDPVIFILWGNNAKEKIKMITNDRHPILTAVHPSPLSASRGFFGCNHFAKVNDLLMGEGKVPINWQISDFTH
ncbi:MAG TPA: uracil-DNA glycosylase [Epulopiscium sp.]|nr:uracil-DNA glycosylase [Candidatus Epulonipiscium sp.]